MIRNSLMALVGLAVLASAQASAQTRNIRCALVDTKGSSIGYAFEVTPGAPTALETAVNKNGSVLTHAPDRRPVWSVQNVHGINMLTYRADPRFTLLIQDKQTPFQGRKSSKAMVVRADNDQVVSKGRCFLMDAQGLLDSELDGLTPSPEFKFD